MALQGLFSKFDVQACVEEIQEQGGCTVPNFMSDRIREALLAEVNRSKFEPQPTEYGPFKTRQEFSALRIFRRRSLFLKLAADLGECLDEKFWRYSNRIFRGPLQFNDLVVQRYQPGPLGIAPHRDSKSCINLVALLVLEGNGRFCFCYDREGTNAKPQRNQPGDLLLMRGPGFLGEDIQPFHFVDQVSEQRTTFALRQKAASA
jgi:hypothetical protein